jgi:hypothetical protein
VARPGAIIQKRVVRSTGWCGSLGQRSTKGGGG